MKINICNCRWKVLAAILLWILAIICVFITAGLELTPWNIDMNRWTREIPFLASLSLHFTLHFTLFQTLIELDVCLRWESVIRRVIFLQQWTDRIDIGRICRRVVFLLSIGHFREGSVVAVKECRASCGHGPWEKVQRYEIIKEIIFDQQSLAKKRRSCLIADESISQIFSYSKSISWFGLSKPRFRLCGGGSWSCMWRKSWGTFVRPGCRTQWTQWTQWKWSSFSAVLCMQICVFCGSHLRSTQWHMHARLASRAAEKVLILLIKSRSFSPQNVERCCHQNTKSQRRL